MGEWKVFIAFPSHTGNTRKCAGPIHEVSTDFFRVELTVPMGIPVGAD